MGHCHVECCIVIAMHIACGCGTMTRGLCNATTRPFHFYHQLWWLAFTKSKRIGRNIQHVMPKESEMSQ